MKHTKKIIFLFILVLITSASIAKAEECSAYGDKLAICEPFSCQYEHPFTKSLVEKKIIGMKEGRCITFEEMPGGLEMTCSLNKSDQNTMVQYLKEIANVDMDNTKIEFGTNSETKINGEIPSYQNTAEMIINNQDTCSISGIE